MTNGPADGMVNGTWCPDCASYVPSDDFVSHREEAHPPETKVLYPVGIESEEAVHGQTKE